MTHNNKVHTIDMYNIIATGVVINTIKSLIYLYIKVVSLLFVVFNVSAGIEAYSIFNRPAYKISEGWYTNEALYPPIIYYVGDDTHISDLIYKQYKLLVFNLVYSRILGGRFHLLKKISLMNIIKVLFYYILGINRVLIVTISTIIKIKPKSTRSDILFKLFSHPVDNRKIIRINNKWVANGVFKFFKNVKSVYDGKNQHKIIDVENSNKILKEVSERIRHVENTIYKTAYSIDKNHPQIKHKIYIEASTGNSVGMETDYYKAIKNKNYNQQPIITKYYAVKDSVLLHKDISSFKNLSAENKNTIIHQAWGAALNGYDQNLISDKYKESITRMVEVRNMLDELIKTNNIDADINDVFKETYNSINHNDIMDE